MPTGGSGHDEGGNGPAGNAGMGGGAGDAGDTANAGNGESAGSAGMGGLLGRLARSMGPEGVELGGDNVRFEQEPERGLEVRITLLDDDGGVTSVASMFLPSGSPPAAHPDGVPFVPGATLRVIEDHVRHVLLAMWLLNTDDAPPPDRALASVIRASREEGWRLDDPAGTEEGGPFRLVRADEVRRVEITTGHTGPVVSLAQKRST